MKLSEINEFKKSENFSVASFLLPKQSRKSLFIVYKLSRYCDEIADDNLKNPQQKIIELNEIYNAIKENNIEKIPEFLMDILIEINNNIFSKKHLLNLLEAFIQDCSKNRYNNFYETLYYCQKSAASIGKIFLESTNEFEANSEYSDKICIVLQILNHLQDLKPDYQKLNRLYFDNTLIEDEADINYSLENPAIKQAKLKILGLSRKYLDESQEILSQIKSTRVRLELALIINAAYALISRLHKKDILRKKVKLKKRHKILIFLKSLPQIFNLKANLLKFKWLKCNFNSSSFLLPMLSLKGGKRRQMLAFYQFCKQIDDCADKNKNENMLSFWQDEINKVYSEKAEIYPKHPVIKQISILVNNQNISKYYFNEMIEGQKMDLQGEMVIPSLKILDSYCFRVASCVGIISAKIFGYKPENEAKINQFAEYLGKYFQYVNILRDFEEDLENNRIYLPSELLQQFNISDIKTTDKKSLKPAFQALSEIAKSHREIAFQSLPSEEIVNMRPAILMDKIYSKYFQMMTERNFEFTKPQIKLSLLQKIFTIFKLK